MLMVDRPRFLDWSSLPVKDRSRALRASKARLASLGRKLHAVAREIEVAPSANGPLEGLPYVAKDMIGTGQGPSSWGCRAEFESGTAPVIVSLAAAGAHLIGTAEMTELAYEPSGLNAARGNVLNPWNFDRVPGGSSSGSATLVAAGCCYAALGSDTGGSVRIPAHCCGVTALKPTRGRVSAEGCMPVAPSLDTIGIMARSAADVGLVSAALFGTAGRIRGTSQIALLEQAFEMSDPDVARPCREAARVLEQAGFETQHRSGFPEAADRHSLTVMQVEAALAHRDRLDDPNIDATLRKRLGKGLLIQDSDYAAALADRETLHGEFASHYLADATAVLLPAVPITTPRVVEVSPGSAQFNPRTLYALSALTRFVNFLGLPAVAVPAGFDSEGMPVAFQLVGRRNSEHALIEIAAEFQSRTGWHGIVPTAVAAEISKEQRNDP
jgi:aspartyl-tRNA(Asn)/glutamyl-tRNA(Gln) amidotransferase subunit A